VRQAAQQLLPLAVKAMQESELLLTSSLICNTVLVNYVLQIPVTLLLYYVSENAELSKEAADIFIWCLTQSPECYKQWVSNILLVCLCRAVLHKLIVTDV
jgi:hypothetical protein